MEWYKVITMYFIAAGIGLLIGYICRRTRKADNRAGQDRIRIIHNNTEIVYHEDNEITAIPHPDIDMRKAIEKGERVFDNLIKSMMFVSAHSETKNKNKFRWKNYYRAKKLCSNGKQISIGR